VSVGACPDTARVRCGGPKADDCVLDGGRDGQRLVESGYAQHATYQGGRGGKYQLRPDPGATVLQLQQHSQARGGEQPDPRDIEDQIIVG
jgi:hypothetical protein